MKTKVIIVDDSEIFRGALRALLEDTGKAEVIDEAINGADLLRKVSKNKPDLVFMDIEMPYMNGFEATTILLETNPGIRVIGMSSYEKDEYVKKLIDAGAGGYLIKHGDNYEIIQNILENNYVNFIFSPEINFHQPLLISNKKVVVIDNDTDIFLEVKYLFRKAGFKVIKQKNIDRISGVLAKNKITAIIVNDDYLISNNIIKNVLLSIQKYYQIYIFAFTQNTEKIKLNTENFIYMPLDFNSDNFLNDILEL